MSNRPELEELLPAYVNGTLDTASRDKVAAAIAQDAELADEVRFLTALRDRIQTDDANTAPGEMGWQRLRRSLPQQRQPGPWSQLLRPVAAVAAAVVITVQAGLLWQAYSPTEPAYIPLAVETRGQIQVRFAPTATAAQMHELLADGGIEIVSGPGASGVYRLRLRGEPDQAEIGAAIAYLDAHDNIVTFVARQ